MLNNDLKNDAVSFKAKIIKELKGNETTDNFSGSAYRGSGNSRAKFVDAYKVIVEDNAIIDCLKLSKGIRSYKPWREFNSFEPDLIIKDGAIINEIKFCRENNSIELIAENSIPVLAKKYQEGQNISYILKKDINIKENIKAEKIELFERAKITSQAFCDHLDLHDSSHVDKFKKLMGQVNMSENSSADDILCSNISMKNDSKCKRVSVVNEHSGFVELHDKATIDSFGVLCGAKLHDEVNLKNVTRAGSLEFYNSSKAGVIENAEKLVLNDKSYVKSAVVNSFSINHEASVDDVSADCAVLSGNSVTKNLSVKNGATIMGNASVNNINVVGENAQCVDFFKNAKLNGVIKFEGAKGVVKIHNDAKTKIDESQVINGTIEYAGRHKAEESKPQSVEYDERPKVKEPEPQSFKPELKIKTKPSIPSPLKGFAKIAGMNELKDELRMDVIEPLLYPQKYAKYKIAPINGLLFYGPPGCGKTYIAEALGEESKRNFVTMKTSDIASKFQHEPAQKIAKKFDEAKYKAPSILFIDEADAIAPNRDLLSQENPDYTEQVTELLTQLNNINEKQILVIFASNEPQNIDKAIKRTGRLDKKIYIGPPDKTCRFELLKMHAKERPMANFVDYSLIVEKTENWAASDIKALSDQAAKFALKEDALISTDHYLNALSKMKPSINKDDIEKYKNKGAK